MGLSGNSHPEWGYLAPAPSFLRTARNVIVATAIGATAGAAVVFSLVDHPAADAGLPTSVAARTLAHPAVETVPTVKAMSNTPTGGGVPVAPAATAAAAPRSTPELGQSGHAYSVDVRVAGRQDGTTEIRAAEAATNEPSALVATAPPAALAGPSDAAAAEPARAQTAAAAETAPAAEPAPAEAAPTPKKTAKKHRTAPRYASRGDQPNSPSGNALSNTFARPLFQRLFNYGGSADYYGGDFRYSGR